MSEIDFDVGPGPDREVFLFSVSHPGTLEMEVRWQGPAKTIYVEVGHILTGERGGKASLTMEGPSPLRGTAEVGPNEIGNWGLGLKTSRGAAQGRVIIKPKDTKISQLKKKELPLARLSPELANFISVYFYYIERALEEIGESKLDDAIRSLLAEAPQHAKDSFKLALKRYKGIPFERKVELGFDPQLLTRLTDVTIPLSQSELENIGRQILSLIMKKIRPPRPKKIPPPRLKDYHQNRRDTQGDSRSDLWSMNLAWTRLKCYDESDSCFIWCTEKGSDEPVAIFVVLEASLDLMIDPKKLSEECLKELLNASITYDLSEVSDECFKELGGITYRNVRHWIKRTKEFGGVDDGDERFGNILLIPNQERQGWHPLVVRTELLKGGNIGVYIPALSLVALIFELDDGVGGIMDALELHAESLERVKAELIDKAISDALYAGHAGLMVGIVLSLIAGWYTIVGGFAIGFIIQLIRAPEGLGYGTMTFTPLGYNSGVVDPEDIYGLRELRPGESSLSLREYTGSNSDYQLDFKLSLEKAELSSISFNPNTIELVERRFLRRPWHLSDEGHNVATFTKKGEAQTALSIIKHYAMTQRLQLGKGRYSMEYWLVNGQSPVGAFEGEDSIDFNPQNLEVRKIEGGWKIVEKRAGSLHWMLDFRERENEARIALRIIQQYGFNHICFVGRSSGTTSMTYFRR